MSGRGGRLPVVCLPGIRGHAGLFRDFSAQVRADQRQAVALDLPPGPPALAAARLSDLPGRFHLITGSYGGLVARHLAAERVASLACIGTLPHPRFLQPAMARRARWICRLPDPLLGRLYRWHGRRALRADGVPEAIVDVLDASPLKPGVLRTRLRAVFDGHHGRPLQVPTLWLHGIDDPQVVWTDADLHDAVPWAASAQVPGGHFPHASHPAELWSRVAGWWTAAERQE